MRILKFALSALASAQTADYFESTTIGTIGTATTGFETTEATTEAAPQTTGRPNTFETTDAMATGPITTGPTTIGPTTVPFIPLEGGRSGARTGGGSVNSLYDVQASLGFLADNVTPAFIFTWTYDATHTSYVIEYQELAGNYANVTDYTPFVGTTESSINNGVTTFALSQPAPNKVYRWKIEPTVGANYGSPTEVLAQSSTTTVVHQPGALYEGGGGFAGQILLPTSFDNANFVKVDSGAGVGASAAADSVGYVMGMPVFKISIE